MIAQAAASRSVERVEMPRALVAKSCSQEGLGAAAACMAASLGLGLGAVALGQYTIKILYDYIPGIVLGVPGT